MSSVSGWPSMGEASVLPSPCSAIAPIRKHVMPELICQLFYFGYRKNLSQNVMVWQAHVQHGHLHDQDYAL